jgi:hypothetical protein
MNEDLIKLLRSKFQEDMRISVGIIENELDKTSEDQFTSLHSLKVIDKAVGHFAKTKEKATHFESIIKHIKNNKNDEDSNM